MISWKNRIQTRRIGLQNVETKSGPKISSKFRFHFPDTNPQGVDKEIANTRDKFNAICAQLRSLHGTTESTRQLVDKTLKHYNQSDARWILSNKNC